MSILKLNNKEYKVSLLDKKGDPLFLKTAKERENFDNIVINISKTVDPKSDINTIRAILYKHLKKTKIKFKDIRIREI